MTAIATDIEAFVAGVPGVYREVPAETYHALKAVSSSLLKRIHTHSPAHAKLLMDEGMEPTDEMDIGSAAHCLLFTPSEFDAQFRAAGRCAGTTGKGNRCWSAGKIVSGGQWYCGVHGRGKIEDGPYPVTVLSPDDMERTRGVVAAIRANDTAAAILAEATDFELSILWHENGVLSKARLDILCAGIGVMPDLKTCRSSDPRRFQYQSRDLAYHVQLAHYRAGALAAGIALDMPTIIAAENTKPHPVTVFRPTARFMEAGESARRAAIDTFCECAQTDHWPGYAEGSIELDII